MRYLLLLIPLCLAGCAGMPISVDEQIERGGTILGQLFTGNYGGAIGGTADLVLILLGLKVAGKGAVKGARVVRERVLNPKPVEPASGKT